MGHDFKPVTTTESIQVAILDELQKITSLLGPSPDPVVTEPEPAADAPAEKPAAKKTTVRKRVTGQ